MKSQPPSSTQSRTARIYSEEEQQLRWTLIIEAILRDSKSVVTPSQLVMKPLPIAKPQSVA